MCRLQSQVLSPLVEALRYTLRQHGLDSSCFDRLNLVGESDPKGRKAGSIGPMRGFPNPRANQRFAAMEEDLHWRDLEDGASRLAVHRETLA